MYEIIFKGRLIKPHLITEIMNTFTNVIVNYSSIIDSDLSKHQNQQIEFIIETSLEMMNNRISSIASAFSKAPQYFSFSILPQILTSLMTVAQSETILSIESFKLICDVLRTCSSIQLFSSKHHYSLFFVIKCKKPIKISKSFSFIEKIDEFYK